jgi:hypothetical protein
MIIECPHCYRTVLPHNDGECPACHKNTEDLRRVDLTKTLLWVDSTTAFPDRCCSCCERTSRRVALKVSSQLSTGWTHRDYVLERPILGLYSFIGHVLYACFAPSRKGFPMSATLKIRLPQCASCAYDNRVEAEKVNLEHGRIAVIVDRNFAQTVSDLNAAPRRQVA